MVWSINCDRPGMYCSLFDNHFRFETALFDNDRDSSLIVDQHTNSLRFEDALMLAKHIIPQNILQHLKNDKKYYNFNKGYYNDFFFFFFLKKKVK